MGFTVGLPNKLLLLKSVPNSQRRLLHEGPFITTSTFVNYRKCPFTSKTRTILTQSILVMIISLSLLSINNLVDADVIILSQDGEQKDQFDDKELPFGSPPLDGIVGRIALADPPNACDVIRNKAPNDTENWFLLATAHPCLPDKQSLNAAEAGYKAIIIYNPDKSKKSSYQGIGKKIVYDLDIISIAMNAQDGEFIKQNYLNDKGFVAVIFPNYPFPLNTYLLPFAVVIIICLFLMVSFLIFQIIKCVRDRRRIQRHRLTNKQLKQLLTTIYTKGSHYDTCAICLEEYVDGQKLRVLPCAHGYHLRCIDPWLTKSRRICPVCKGKVRVAGMSDISDTESESDQSRQVNHNHANESTPLLRGQRPLRSQDLDIVI